MVYGWLIKQLYDTLSTLSRHISLANALFHPPERVIASLPNSFRTVEEGLRSRYISVSCRTKWSYGCTDHFIDGLLQIVAIEGDFCLIYDTWSFVLVEKRIPKGGKQVFAELRHANDFFW